MPLAWGENGYRQLSNSKHEIKTPADMKGLKLRVVGSPLYIDTFTALGANPTQMSWADAQPALASGAVNGQENPLSIYTGSKLYTVGQKYLTLWNYVADPLIYVVNREVWNSWSEKDREIVRQAALDAGKQQIVIARKGVTPEDPSLLKEIAGHGVTVSSLDAGQHAEFVAATKPVYEKWKKQIAPNWSTWPRNRSRPARNKQQPKGNGGASRHARQGRTTLQPNGRRPKAGVRFFSSRSLSPRGQAPRHTPRTLAVKIQ
ncbi:TRAP-type C4-dicarboxylate transport system, periplasmic component [Bordetella pertussis]|nr:TRAP-type C4-dicarboxylate transport system, periplasmic component [Bordetella pertussis]